MWHTRRRTFGVFLVWVFLLTSSTTWASTAASDSYVDELGDLELFDASTWSCRGAEDECKDDDARDDGQAEAEWHVFPSSVVGWGAFAAAAVGVTLATVARAAFFAGLWAALRFMPLGAGLVTVTAVTPLGLAVFWPSLWASAGAGLVGGEYAALGGGLGAEVGYYLGGLGGAVVGAALGVVGAGGLMWVLPTAGFDAYDAIGAGIVGFAVGGLLGPVVGGIAGGAWGAAYAVEHGEPEIRDVE